MKWIYLAGPLFTQAEIAFNALLTQSLRAAGYRVYLPQEECSGITDPVQLFETCIRGLEGCGLMVVVLDGPDADSGSCFEMGYAWTKEIPIVGLRTDFRGSGEHMGINLMLTHACTHLVLTGLVAPPVQDWVTFVPMGQDLIPHLLTVISRLEIALQVLAP